MASTTASTPVETGHPSTESAPSLANVNIGSTRKKHNRHLKFGFGGPLILIIDTQRGYCRTVWLSIMLGLVNLLIGAVNMTVIAYSAKTGDVHAAFCTLAFHFFSAEAIISLNYANGWSAPMRMRHRKLAHVLLQILGMAFAIIGVVFVLSTDGLSGSFHGITGIVTVALAGLSVISGPCALFGNRYPQMVHMIIGIPTFFVSSLSLCLGFLTDAFSSWATSTIVFVLIGFVSFYTMFFVGTIFIKCTSRL